METLQLANRLPEIHAMGLVDLDLTAVAGSAIVLLLLAGMNGFLIQPYLNILRERTRQIDGARASATAMSAKAEQALADYEARLDAARTDAAKERERLRRDAERAQAGMLTEAREAAASRVDEGRARLASEADAAASRVKVMGGELADSIVRRVLGQAA